MNTVPVWLEREGVKLEREGVKLEREGVKLARRLAAHMGIYLVFTPAGAHFLQYPFIQKIIYRIDK